MGGWIGDFCSLDLDPDLPHGLEDVPVASPTFGQHDRVATHAAARGAVGVCQEEDAVDDEETLGGRARRDLVRAGRAPEGAVAAW